MAHVECPLKGNAHKHLQLSPSELDEQALIFEREINIQYEKQAKQVKNKPNKTKNKK